MKEQIRLTGGSCGKIACGPAGLGGEHFQNHFCGFSAPGGQGAGQVAETIAGN
jgi:hypothetical protein